MKPAFTVTEKTNGLHFVFKSDMTHIDKACEQTTAYLKERLNGISKDLFAINLVLREGLTNAIRHGNANDHSKVVDFSFLIGEDGCLRVCIQDEGEGFDWQVQQLQEPEEDDDHGRGILIMETYFSRYRYNDKGNILYLEKELDLSSDIPES